jgi:hypothetical protein
MATTAETLQRFMMAFPKHPAKALDAARAYLIFRQKYGLDAQDPSVFPVDATVQEILHVYVHSHKTETAQLDVSVTRLGTKNLKALLSGSKVQLQELERRFLVYHVHLMEHMLYLGRLHGRHVETSIMLSDMRGFGTCHVNATFLGMLKKMSQLDDKYYPNITHEVYLLHCPSFLKTVWTIISPLLSNTIRHRIHFAKSPSDMQGVLSAAHFPEDLLVTRPTPLAPLVSTTATAPTATTATTASEHSSTPDVDFPSTAASTHSQPCTPVVSEVAEAAPMTTASTDVSLSTLLQDPHW